MFTLNSFFGNFMINIYYAAGSFIYQRSKPLTENINTV